MSKMHNPPHPGQILREEFLPALGMDVADAAHALGVAPLALSRVLDGAAAITPDLAQRIERWLGAEHGGRAGLWLDMQGAYDQWIAEQKAH